MSQLRLALPLPYKPVTYDDLVRVQSFHGAIRAAMDQSGMQDKSIAIESQIDDAQLSKIASGQSGIQPDKLLRLQRACRSRLPLFYLNWADGMDPLSMRERESELERQLREERQKVAALETKLANITEFVREAKAA